MLLKQKFYSVNSIYRSAVKNKGDENASFKNKYSIGNSENYFLGKKILQRQGVSKKSQCPKFCSYSQPMPISKPRHILVIVQSCEHEFVDT